MSVYFLRVIFYLIHLYGYRIVIVLLSQNSVFITIGKLTEIIGLDRRTVMKYIKLLYEAEVLFCITIKMHAKKDKNFNGGYQHKHLIKEEAIQKTETY